MSPAPTLRGALDQVDGHALVGWASVGAAKASAVELWHGDHLLMTVAPTLDRPDVEAAGAGPLTCGFTFDANAIAHSLRKLDGGGMARPFQVRAGGAVLGVTAPLDSDDFVDAAALAWAVRTLNA